MRHRISWHKILVPFPEVEPKACTKGHKEIQGMELIFYEATEAVYQSSRIVQCMYSGCREQMAHHLRPSPDPCSSEQQPQGQLSWQWQAAALSWGLRGRQAGQVAAACIVFARSDTGAATQKLSETHCKQTGAMWPISA